MFCFWDNGCKNIQQMQKDFPEKIFGNSEFCSSRQSHSRPNSLQNCGFGGKNKTQSFQKLFSGDIFLYLFNIFATVVAKTKQKISKL